MRMLKRYVGPHDEVRVIVAGNDLGTVKNGESIAVPAELADLTEWPDGLWQDGATKSGRKSARKSDATADDAAPSGDDGAAATDENAANESEAS